MTLTSRQSGGQAGTGRPNKVKTSPPKTWQPFICGSENAGHGIYNFRNPWNENTEAFLEPGLRRPELGLCGMWLCYKSLWVSVLEQWYSPLTRNECWLLTVIICGWGEGFPCSTGVCLQWPEVHRMELWLAAEKGCQALQCLNLGVFIVCQLLTVSSSVSF